MDHSEQIKEMIPPSSGYFGPTGTWVTQTQLCHQKAQPRVANSS